MDESKVIEAVEWIERVAQSSRLLERFRHTARHLALLNPPADVERAKIATELHPFTGSSITAEIIPKTVEGREVIVGAVRWKLIVGLEMPLSHWQSIVRLSDEETELFRVYVPAIPNDWYSAVGITVRDGVEMLSIEQHFLLTKDESEELDQKMRPLAELLVKSGHPKLAG